LYRILTGRDIACWLVKKWALAPGISTQQKSQKTILPITMSVYAHK
jgi:hypothetical protein